MAISIVQTATGTGNPPVTFASPVTVGNTVILVAPCYNTGGTNNTVSGVKLGTNTITGTVAFFNNGTTGGVNSASSGGNVAYISIWMLPNVQVSGQTQVDYTPSGSQVGQVAYEVAGLGTSPSLDQSASGSGITTGTVTTGATGAITGAPELIVGGAMIFAGATGAPSGFTTANPTGDCWAGYQIAVSSGGTYTWTQTGNGNPWAVALATILGTPAAPTPSNVLISAPYRPPPPPLRVPVQLITGQAPAAPAELAGTIQGAAPYRPPWQIAPQVITGATLSVSDSDTGTAAESSSTALSSGDTGTGADSGSATVQSSITAMTLIPPGRQSPLAFRFRTWPSQAPVLTPVSSSDTGSASESSTTGLSSADTASGAESSSTALSDTDAAAAAESSSAALSSGDTASGADSGSVVTATSPSYSLLIPPGRSSPAAFRFVAPQVPPAVATHAVSDSDTATAVDGEPLAPRSTPSQDGWWQLHEIFKYREQERDYYASVPPLSCPRCGEPWTNAPPTDSGSSVELFCRYDGFRYPEDGRGGL